jgi:hypothetical protein
MPMSLSPIQNARHIDRDTSLWYRIRVTVWLLRELTYEFTQRSSWVVPICILGAVFVLLSVYGAVSINLHHFQGTASYRADLAANWVWISFFIISYWTVNSKNASRNALYFIDTDHLLSLPISLPQGYALIYVDCLLRVLPLMAFMLLLAPAFSSSFLSFLLICIITAVYVFALSVWRLFFRLIYETASKLRSTALGCLLSLFIVIILLAGCSVMISAPESLEQLPPPTSGAQSSHFDDANLLVDSVLGYTLPGSVAGMCVVANGYSSRPFLVFLMAFVLNTILIGGIGYLLLLPLSREIAPMKNTGDKANRETKDILRSRKSSKLGLSLDYLWVYLVRNPQLREMMLVQGLGDRSIQVLVIIVIVFALLIRMSSGFIEPSAMTETVILMMACILAVFSPPALISASGVVSRVSLQTSVSRWLLFYHVGLLLAARYIFLILVLSFIVSPWSNGNMPGLTSTALLTCGIFIMNIANTFITLVLLRSSVQTEISSSGARILDSSSVLNFAVLLIGLQVFVLPLLIAMFKTINWDKEMLVAPPRPLLITLLIYSIIYFFVGLSYAAKKLERDDLEYCETGLS